MDKETDHQNQSDSISKKVDAIEQKLEQSDQRLEKILAKLESHEESASSTKSERRKVRDFVGVFTIMLGLLGIWVNWREQIKTNEIQHIEKNLVAIEHLKQKLNYSFAYSR